MGQQLLFAAPGIQINLSEFDPQKPIQVLRTGSFHDFRYGVLDITKAMLLSMKKNFDAKVRGVDLAIDYRHDSGGVAAGWIKKVFLKNGNTELWAEVDWTPKGSQVLADKEFRYISADFALDYEDNETLKKYGPTLFGAALTNRPVVKRMKPAIELHELTDKEREEMNEIEKLQKELEAEKAKVTQLEEQNKKLSEQVNAAGESEEGEALKTEIKNLQTQLSEVQAENKKLSDKYEEMKKNAELAEKESKFQKLLSEGKAVPAQKEAFLAGDMEKFVELSQPVNLKAKGHGGEGENLPKTAEEADKLIKQLAEEKVAKTQGLTFSDALNQVRAERPDIWAIRSQQ